MVSNYIFGKIFKSKSYISESSQKEEQDILPIIKQIIAFVGDFVDSNNELTYTKDPKISNYISVFNLNKLTKFDTFPYTMPNVLQTQLTQSDKNSVIVEIPTKYKKDVIFTHIFSCPCFKISSDTLQTIDTTAYFHVSIIDDSSTLDQYLMNIIQTKIGTKEHIKEFENQLTSYFEQSSNTPLPKAKLGRKAKYDDSFSLVQYLENNLENMNDDEIDEIEYELKAEQKFSPTDDVDVEGNGVITVSVDKRLGYSKPLIFKLFPSIIAPKDELPRKLNVFYKTVIKNITKMKTDIYSNSQTTANDKTISHRLNPWTKYKPSKPNKPNEIDEKRTDAKKEEYNNWVNNNPMSKELGLQDEKKLFSYIEENSLKVLDVFKNGITNIITNETNSPILGSHNVRESVVRELPELTSIGAFMLGKCSFENDNCKKLLCKVVGIPMEEFNSKGYVFMPNSSNFPLADSILYINKKQILLSTKAGEKGEGSPASLKNLYQYLYFDNGEIRPFGKKVQEIYTTELEMFNFLTSKSRGKELIPQIDEMVRKLISTNEVALSNYGIAKTKPMFKKGVDSPDWAELILNVCFDWKGFVEMTLKAASMDFAQIHCTPTNKDDDFGFDYLVKYPAKFVGTVRLKISGGSIQFKIG